MSYEFKGQHPCFHPLMEMVIGKKKKGKSVRENFSHAHQSQIQNIPRVTSKANVDGSNQITREGGDFWGKEEDRDL